MSEITVKELEEKIERAFELKKEWQEIKKKQTEKNQELVELQGEIGVILEGLEMTSYKSKAGLFMIQEQVNYRLPQDDESRSAFFNYLKEKGVYDQMIGINSQRLQSFVKAEVELAEREEDFDFLPDGIQKSEVYTKYSMRKS